MSPHHHLTPWGTSDMQISARYVCENAVVLKIVLFFLTSRPEVIAGSLESLRPLSMEITVEVVDILRNTLK